MALFLTEAVFQSSYQGNYIDLLIEQSEIQSELLALNEAIYQADFIIHEKSRNLSEAAAMQLQEGFLSNVWEKVKAYVLKAWNWVKDFAKKIKDKIVEIYNRIKDRIKGDSVELAKSKVADMEAAVTFIEQNAKLMEKLKGQTNDTVSKSIKEQGVKLKADFDKKKEANAKMTGNQKVSFTYFDKLVKASQMNETISTNVARDFEAEIKALEAKHKEELDFHNAMASSNDSKHAALQDKLKASQADHATAMAGKDKTISDLQTQINGMKVAAAIGMELARAAGAAATAAAATPTASGTAPLAPEEKAEAANKNGLPTGIQSSTTNAKGGAKGPAGSKLAVGNNLKTMQAKLARGETAF